MMNSAISKQDVLFKIVRWVARIIGTFAATLLLIIGIGEMIGDIGPVTWEGIMVVGFIVLLTISVIIAWLKEGIGGIILIVVAVAYAIFIYFSAGRNKILASLSISAPFLISGILFCVYGIKKAK